MSTTSNKDFDEDEVAVYKSWLLKKDEKQIAGELNLKENEVQDIIKKLNKTIANAQDNSNVLDSMKLSSPYSLPRMTDYGRDKSLFNDIFLNPATDVKKELDQTVFTNFGFNLGHNLSSLENKVREEAFQRAEKNIQMAWGLGSGIGSIFHLLDNSTREEIFQRAEKNLQMAAGLGSGIGSIFHLLDNGTS